MAWLRWPDRDWSRSYRRVHGIRSEPSATAAQSSSTTHCGQISSSRTRGGYSNPHYGTPLNIALRDCGIVALSMVGVALEAGIEPTVRHAADLVYIPVLVADVCVVGDQKAAERSLESLRFTGDALISNVESFA